MNRIASEILKIAAEIDPQVVVSVKTGGVTESTLLNIQLEVQRFVSSVRKNESLESVVTRKDDDNSMVLSIGFTDHEAKEAIVREVKKLADKLARKFEVKATTSVL